MIILRYLTRDILLTTLAITLVLFIIIVSGDLSRYLWEAMKGKIDPAVLFSLVLFRMPSFLELIAPLGFIVAIIMVYGRLYADQEMTVLYACGFSRIKMLGLAFVSGLVVAAVCGLVSLWLTPYGLEQSEIIKEEQKNRSDLELVQSGRFQIMNNGNMVSYVESASDGNSDDKQASALGKIFVASVGVQQGEQPLVLQAESARRIRDEESGQFYLQLQNGVRYEGQPGEARYRITRFSEFAQHLDQPKVVELDIDELEAMPTLALLQSGETEFVSALQRRLSVPVIVLVMTLFAVSLSHTTPRKGRYAMLFPVILLYMIYVVLLDVGRIAIDKGQLPQTPGLWLVHSLVFLLAAGVFVLRGGVTFSGSKVSSKKVDPDMATPDTEGKA